MFIHIASYSYNIKKASKQSKMIQSQRVMWFTLGFASAAAAVMAVVVFKDLCFDRQTLFQQVNLVIIPILFISFSKLLHMHGCVYRSETYIFISFLYFVLLQFKAENVDIKVSYNEPALLRQSPSLLNLNVTVGKPE